MYKIFELSMDEMAKICLPKGSGKESKVSEKSGNFEMDIEWQPWKSFRNQTSYLVFLFSTAGSAAGLNDFADFNSAPKSPG